MSYRKLFARLRKEISLLDFNRKKLNEEQKSMLSFIEGKKSIAQFNIDNKVITLGRGDKFRGFEHILIGHYSEKCEGGLLTAREILNIGLVLKYGRELTTFELNERDTRGYEDTKNDIRYRVILNEDRLVEKVLSYYSDREDERTEEIKVEMGDLF